MHPKDFLDSHPAGTLLHAVIMRYFDGASLVKSLAGSFLAMGGGVTAQVTTGAAQGAGVVAAVGGLLGMVLPLYFADRRHQREVAAKTNEVIAALQRTVQEQANQIAEHAKQTPQVDANTRGLQDVRARQDRLFELLKNKQWLGEIEPELPAVPVRVLIVEDDLTTARTLVRLLGNEGFEVDYAAGVAKALDMLGGPTPYDWLILDLKIDGGEGEQVLEHVRSRKLSTRVAVTTGNKDGSRLEALSLYAPEKIFLKPVRWHELIDTLRSDADDPPGKAPHA